MPAWRMSLRAGIQFIILLFGVAFESVREAQGAECRSLICFGEESEMYLRSHIYYIMEHLIYLILVWMIWDNSQKEADIKTDRFFIFIALADFVDYWITGNNVWYKLPLTYSENSWFFILPFSMNVCSVVCFLLYANWQWRINMNGKR